MPDLTAVPASGASATPSRRPTRGRVRRAAAFLLAGVLLVSGCSSGASDGDAQPQAQPTAPTTPSAPTSPTPTPTPPTGDGVGQRIQETVSAQLGGVELVLEVADEPGERAVGLMGRTEVPDGTGMLFVFEEPTSSSFYMFQVPVPLVAVFVREGTVVGVEQMEPCTETDPAACPLYGPDEPFDAVVETAPETLPDVAVGDALVLAGG